MNAPTAPDLSALSDGDAALVAALAEKVLASPRPPEMLLDEVTALEIAQKPAVLAALYEALCYRVDVSEYWMQYRVWKAYAALGEAREDAAFSHAAAVVRQHPDWAGSDQAYRSLFQYLHRRGRDREALALFRYQMQFMPEQPSARPEIIAELTRRLEPGAGTPPPPPAEGARIHAAIAEEWRPGATFPAFGGRAPYSVAMLAEPALRPAITIAEFADAEVLAYYNTVMVLDRAGHLQEASSVGDYLPEVRAKFERLEEKGEPVLVREADEAVVISDRHPAPNICHMLFDQISRLALYERAGVDIGRALVIGPELPMPAQQQIFRRAGGADHVGTYRVARVRARRLWVSSNCRGMRHAGHLGADWVVQYARRILGGQGAKGWRRLYISRADVSARQVVNEAEVMALLEPHGFEAIVPGRMSYEAQLSAFRQASHVIGPHGAGLTHLVLCPPGAHVLEIFHPLYGTAAYAMEAAAAGVNYAAMVGRDWESDAPHWNDPALVDVGLSQYLSRHLRVDLAELARYLAAVT